MQLIRALFIFFIIGLLLVAPSLARQEEEIKPPVERGQFLKPDLVELVEQDPTLRLDIRYATSSNFLGRPVYTEASAFLQRPAARALARVNRKLRRKGYGLLIFDGYRPWSVTKIFWDATPAEKRAFVADPRRGSRHNRGCAVDLTLFDLKTGQPLKMPSEYDDFSERAHPNYQGGTAEERRNRDTLRAAMEAEGFTVYENEWWHFDYKDWKRYAILNISFREAGRRRN
jgi:D-alanyl-D-alanine dipeptidase